jgi:PAS domain S-box-containing protein
MKNKILDFIDFEKVDTLLEGFNKSTGFVTAILDLEGNVLSKSGWRQTCTQFHRIHPATSKKCTISDTELANKMADGKKYHFYKCLNGLVDVAVPIVINGEHIANLFSGQFFFEEPDISFFKKQAKKHGFDENEYLDALSKVPIVSEEKVKTVLDFLLSMTQMISEITFQKIEQTELNKTIRESEEKFSAIYENINDAVFIHKILHNGEPGNFLYFNSAAIKSLGYTSEELKSMSPRELDDPDNAGQYIPKVMKQLKEQRMSKFEAVQIAKDGRKIDIEVNAVVAKIGDDDHIVSVCRDITQKKNFQRILTENEQFLSAIYKGISHSLFVVDVLENGDFQYAGLNPQHEKITGISTDFIKGKKPEDVLPEEAALNVRNRYAECVNLKQTIAYEEWLPFRGNHTCWETILNPQINESGDVYQIIGTSLEITKRKQTEEELRTSQNNYKNLVENTPDIIYSLNSEGRFTFVSKNVSRYGFTPEEMIGHHIQEFIHPDDIEDVLSDFYKSFELKVPIRSEFRLASKDGSITWFEDTSRNLIENGDVVGFTGIIHDITERRLAEEKLRESEEKLTSIFNNMIDVVWSISWPDLTHNFISPSLEKLYGRSKQELLDNPNLFQDITHPDDQHLTEKAMKQLLEEGKAERECRIIKPDGSIVWVNDRSKMIYDENQQPIRVDGVTRDITERKQAEEEYLKFFTITENSLYGSAIADPEGHLVYVNDYFAQIHGYTAKELIGRNLDILHSDAQMPLVKKTIEKALEKGNIESVEIHHLHKNGREFPMLMSLAVINDSLGKSKYIAATAFDLTEQKTIQQKLQDTVNDQNLLLNNDPTLIYFKDCNNNIIRVTESVAKATGLTREEIEGRPSKEIYPDMADQYWKDDLEVIKSGKPKHNIVEPLTGIDGSSHWLLTTKVPVKNDSGEIVGICVFATDITDLKNAELELIAAKDKAEESEQRFRSLIENAPDGVVIIDERGKFKYVSPNAERLFGYNKDEAIGRSGDESTHPDDLPLVLKTMETIFADPGLKPKVQYRFKRKNGEFRWIETTFTNLLSDKAINGIVLNFSDVTERKQIFEELLIAKEKAEESEKKYRLLTEFAADVVWVLNLTTEKFTYISPSIFQLRGFTVEEAMNETLEDSLTPESLKIVREQLLKIQITL